MSRVRARAVDYTIIGLNQLKIFNELHQ